MNIQQHVGSYYESNSRAGSNQKSASKVFTYAVNYFDCRHGTKKTIAISGVTHAEAEMFVKNAPKAYGTWYNIVRWDRIS